MSSKARAFLLFASVMLLFVFVSGCGESNKAALEIKAKQLGIENAGLKKDLADCQAKNEGLNAAIKAEKKKEIQDLLSGVMGVMAKENQKLKAEVASLKKQLDESKK
ncbi:MAG: hypothetical protein E4H40_06570 [Candidatus Brocadiia bacterium]|nr:MAG: hypothetical protein E4H40_06570 [Candidatus Brocadiia bacterium]